MIDVEEVGPDRAAEVLAVIHAGFGAREVLEPPSTATLETDESIAKALAEHGGLLAVSELGAVGALVFEPADDLLGLRRVAVHPDAQTRGVARTMVRRAERVARARGFEAVRLHARAELPRTVRFWQRLGYRETGREGTMITLAKELPIEVETTSPEQARSLGERLATILRAGDLVILSGDLGAGKTTFTQGFGAALGVDEPITSPTFVLMRTYEGTRLPIVHMDVYRLEHLQEAVDLGLAEILDDGAVALVEWGDLVAAVLPADFLEIAIEQVDGDDTSDDDRVLRIRPVGSRWHARMRGLADALAPWASDEGPA
jgi:tRNA threonylcarbamoyladenosine biosynthesis protein TsaE